VVQALLVLLDLSMLMQMGSQLLEGLGAHAKFWLKLVTHFGKCFVQAIRLEQRKTAAVLGINSC
jgi:hypothetical protein